MYFAKDNHDVGCPFFFESDNYSLAEYNIETQLKEISLWTDTHIMVVNSAGGKA